MLSLISRSDKILYKIYIYIYIYILLYIYILHIEVLYDRGVKFGLAGGRFESVMVSGRPFPFSVPALSRSFRRVTHLSICVKLYRGVMTDFPFPPRFLFAFPPLFPSPTYGSLEVQPHP